MWRVVPETVRAQALAATSKIDIVDRKQISFFIAIFDSAFYRIL